MEIHPAILELFMRTNRQIGGLSEIYRRFARFRTRQKQWQFPSENSQEAERSCIIKQCGKAVHSCALHSYCHMKEKKTWMQEFLAFASNGFRQHTLSAIGSPRKYWNTNSRYLSFSATFM